MNYIHRIISWSQSNCFNSSRIYVNIKNKVFIKRLYGRRFRNLYMALKFFMRFIQWFLLRFTILLIVLNITRISSLLTLVSKLSHLSCCTHSLQSYFKILHRFYLFFFSWKTFSICTVRRIFKRIKWHTTFNSL